MNKMRIYINCLISGYIFLVIYTQFELSIFTTFVLIAFMLFIILYYELRISVHNTEVSRKADPVSLYPSVFFDEIFSLCDKKDRLIIENLQKDIEALQPVRPLKNQKYNIFSISESIKRIEQKYEECLKNYLTNPMNLKTQKTVMIRLKSKLELCHKAIEKEKEAFVSDNGQNTVSFNFNTQNQFTDILLTGISIPILLETLKWEVNNIEDFLLTLEEKPIMCLITGAFLITLFYRVLKYTINKRSMLKGMRQTVLYDKAELMLYSFECALKNIEN